MASSATKALAGMPVLPLLLRHGGPATGRLVAVDRDLGQPGWPPAERRLEGLGS